MKKLFTIIFTAISITSLLSGCQNNLDQSTKTILDNVANLKKKIQEIPSELKPSHTNISADQIISMLLIENITTHSTFSSKKDEYYQLQFVLNWFQEVKNIDSWINYLAIHNQIYNAIKNDFNVLRYDPKSYEYCKKFSEIIINVFTNTIIEFHDNKTISKNDLFSLIYAYQDYIKLFDNFIKIDDEKIRSILKDR